MSTEGGAAKPVPTARIRFGSWAELVRFLMQESEGRGLFVRAGSPPAIGTDLTVQFSLPDGRDLSLAARVVHRVGPEQSKEPGMGVQFTHMSEEQAARLQQLMSNPEVTRSIHEARPAPAKPAPTKPAPAKPAPAKPAPAKPAPAKPAPAKPAPAKPAPVKAAAANPAPTKPARVPSEPPRAVPVSMEPRLVQALTQLERTHFDAAERLAMDVLGDDPTDREAQQLLLVVQARRFRSQFDFDRAIQKYKAVLKLNPQHPEAREQLAGLDSDIARSQELFKRVFGGEDR